MQYLLLLVLITLPALGSTKVYNRDDFGIWASQGCLTTRETVLIKNSTTPIEWFTDAKTKSGCKIQSGTWLDRYSNQTITDPLALDIDHAVPLLWAFNHGAASWTISTKHAFGNDLVNLNPTTLHLNRQKGDLGITEWLPPYVPYQCDYIRQFDSVKRKYHLRYTAKEAAFVKAKLSVCKNNPL
jgi:hypothetical protein